MKTYAKRMIMCAAGTVIFGTMAFGEIRAEIPFAFHTANASLPAGTYTISRMKNNGVMNVTEIYNAALRKSALVISRPPEVNRVPADTPVIVFACGRQGCQLMEIKTGSLTYSYSAGHNAARGGEAVTAISVPLIVSNGD